MGAAAGLWSAGCLPQKPRVLLEPGISPNLQALGRRSRWGEPAGGEGGGVTHWGERLVLVIDPQITQGREDCLPGEGLEGALWERTPDHRDRGRLADAARRIPSSVCKAELRLETAVLGLRVQSCPWSIYQIRGFRCAVGLRTSVATKCYLSVLIESLWYRAIGV